MEEMLNNGLTVMLEPVDTTEMAKKRSIQIFEKIDNGSRKDVYQTFFLNGAWGSGKSDFLDKIEEQFDGAKSFNKLKLWEVKDDRTVMEQTYELLHPYHYTWTRIMFAVGLTVSAIITPATFVTLFAQLIKHDLWPWYINALVLILETLAVFMTMMKVTKNDGDGYYVDSLAKESPETFKNKVLVFDDFDRVDSKEVQAQAYKVFNVLKGKLPIIFVGDSRLISNEKGSFVNKIIDSQISLPSQLNTKARWTRYIHQIYATVAQAQNENYADDVETRRKYLVDGQNVAYTGTRYGAVKTTLINLAVLEKRSLRDLDQFVRVVNEYFFKLKKYETTDIRDQLLVLYIYQFYPGVYDSLKINNKINVNDTAALNVDGGENGDEAILRQFDNLFIETAGALAGFYDNPAAYYVFEDGINMTRTEVIDILENENAFEKIIMGNDGQDDLEDSKRTQVMQLIAEVVVTKPNWLQDFNITKSAVKAVLGGYYNQLVIGVINQQQRIFSSRNNGNHLSGWVEFFDEIKLPISKELFVRYTSGQLENWPETLNDNRYDIDLSSINPSNDEFSDQSLLAYIKRREWTNANQWTENIRELIELLPSKQYVRFWSILGWLIPVDETKHEIKNVLGTAAGYVLRDRFETSGVMEPSMRSDVEILMIKRHIRDHGSDFENYSFFVQDVNGPTAQATKMTFDGLSNVLLSLYENQDDELEIFGEPLSVEVNASDLYHPDGYRVLTELWDFQINDEAFKESLLKNIRKSYKTVTGVDFDFSNVEPKD